MKKIGYIVSKRKISEPLDFVAVVNDFSEIDDPTKPILIVGLESAKEYSSNFSILDKRISDNIYWTFSKTERRVDYDKDINDFYNMVLEYNVSKIKYYYVDILRIKYTKVKNLINIINSNIKKYIYFSKNMIYIYYGHNILGISIDILKYININIKKIYGKIKSNINNIVYTNDSFLNSKMRKIIRNKKYVMAYFISIIDCDERRIN